MGSKGSSSSSFTPPPEVVAAYKEALGYGREAMGQQYAPYTGEITAPLTPTQESGIYNVNRAVGAAIPYFGKATELVDQYTKTPVTVSAPGQLSQASQLAAGATGVIAPVASPEIAKATQMYGGMAGKTITPEQFSQSALQEYMSPYTQAVADATFRNLREQQTQEQMGLRGGAIRAGAFGGDRAGIAAANMARQQDLATAQAMSNIYNQGYSQATGLFGQQQAINLAAQQTDAARQMQVAQQLAGIGAQQQGVNLSARQSDAARQLQAAQQLSAIGLQQQALDVQAQQTNKIAQLQAAQQMAGLGTGLQSSVLQGAQAQLAAGAQQQAAQQAINSGYYNQYLAAQAYPYQQAQFFANLATGVGGQMGGTTTGTPAQPSPVGSIFGALGALGSVFSASDKRVKENIKPIGRTNDGQTIYRYNFKGDPTTQIGLIAQEVEKKHPEAVRTFNGVKGVDYKEATDDSVRSMGGGVVPSGERHRFAAGGNLDTEEDPMVPYRAGVPARVLQIPKLAKIGGSKPNFGGNPPSQPTTGGLSPSEMKGAAEGLGKFAKKYDLFGSKSSSDSEDSPISGISDWLRGEARGGAIPAYRPRFADGEDVPVTQDSIYIPERDKADLVRPSFNPDSDAAPVRLASLGDVARRTDAGIPSSEPVREPSRGSEPKVGLVPSMARGDSDLPPLFSGKETPEPSRMSVAAAQAVNAEPEAKPAGIVPSMARTDANVPEVKPGLEPTKAQTATQSNPILEMIRVEAERQGVPFEIAKQVAGIESGYAPGSKAGTSSAGGIYGITKGTMADLGGDYSKVYDPEHNIRHGVKYIGQNLRALTSPDDPNAGAKVYMGHFFGTAGAKGILQNPDAPISQTLSNYEAAVKSNPGVTFKGKPIAEWTGRDAQEWAAAKMAGTYEPREGRAQTAGLGAKPVQIASTDNKNWPGFGIAGEGKRSIIESLMDKDFDPIQKRALFSFFAGMAASPSPWFGQQLGAGMQAASQVYNDSLNKQNELDVRKQQLGMEKERVDIQGRLADVQEKTKAIEALKFWQSRFKQIPTADGFSYLDTTTGQTISQDEYNAQMANLMKQYKLTPAEAGSATPKPGLAPAAGSAAPAGSAPAAGVVPAPKAEPKAPEVDAGASPEPTPSVNIPKPTEVPKPAPQAKPVEAAAPKGDTETKIYENVRDDYNPIVLRQKADEQRKIAANAQKLGDLQGAKAANDLADSYSSKAIDITENKVPVVFKDGTVGRIPQIEQEALRAESVKGAQKINVEENTKWFNEQAQEQVKRNMLIARNNELIKINKEFESGRFAEEKANIVASLRAVGINVPSTATANPEKFQEFIKNRINNVFDEVKAIGGQVRVAEITGLEAGQSGPMMESIANRAILGYNKGVLEWENKKFEDAVKAAKNVGINQFNRPEWVLNWSKENDLNKYINDAKKSTATLGATPQNPSDLEPEQHYILRKGEYGAPKQGEYVFRGIKEQNGQRGLVFEPVGRQ